MFLRASIAFSDVREFRLYGAFTLFMSWTTEGWPMAKPQRMPARPKALDSVWRTTTLSNSSTRHAIEPPAAKSTYASSRTTMPSNSDASLRTSETDTHLAVGLPGEHTQMIFVRASTAASMASTRSSKPSVRGTSLTATSLTAAQTLYMPYVGGVVMTLSREGTQKMRKSMSMASSEPTPTNTWEGTQPRMPENSSLRGIW
mmetsp:Transcript_1732/g.3209  ORF Transcript_1732/g.3209 Transcript_1732/m.3209 type:complete len:201 (-) Transcript_1732:193-795(-)